MSSILFEIKQGIAFITLNRPDKFNSFNREMALQLQARLDECASLHEIRCVYITGAGQAFSAGQDIGELVGENKIEIANILTDEFCATGINDDYEPNDRGLRVEELIDIVLKL